MLVSSIALNGFLSHESVDLTRLTPSVDVREILITPEVGASFSANSNDSQILIELDTASFYWLVFLRALGFSLAVGLLGFVLSFLALRRRIRSRSASTEGTSTDTPTNSEGRLIPVWATWAFATLAAFGVFMLFYGSQVIGISWDESIHEESLVEYFQSGWLVPRAYFGQGLPDAAYTVVYGPVALIFLQLGGAVLGVHSWFGSSFSAAAFESRHLFVAILSLVAIFSVFVIARLLWRSWRWAILALAVVFSIPLWVGHSMFNVKDLPVAAGFTLFTLGLVLMSRDTHFAKARWWALIGVTLGSIIAVGSRPGIWVALLASTLGTFSLLLLIDARTRGMQEAVKRSVFGVLSVSSGFMLALVLLWVVYPAVFHNPPQLLWSSVSASRTFVLDGGSTLTAGSELAANPPWTYIPLWLGAQLPLLVIITAVTGLLGLLITYVARLASSGHAETWVRGGIPIALQAIVVPVASLVLGSTLYGGLRQLLFIYPAIALLSVLGIFNVGKYIDESSRQIHKQALWIGIVIGLLFPFVSQWRLFPYNFAHFNPVAATQNINESWDVDGWWLSGRELVENQMFPERTFCVESAARPLADCDKIPVIEPYLVTSPDSDIALEEDEYVVLNRFPESFTASTCELLFSVTRGLWWQEVEFSAAKICKAELAPYPSGGIDFNGITVEDEYLMWGWNPYLLWGWGATNPRGVELRGSTGSLGFTFDQSEQTTNLEVVGFSPSTDGNSYSLRAFVNGTDFGSVSLGTNQESQTLDFAIPQSAWAASEDGRTIVRFEIEGGSLQTEGADPSELRVFNLERLVLN